MNINQNDRIRVAHRFNEELTILLNSACVAARLLGPEHPANDTIVMLKRSVDRCTELSRKLLP